ncbi:hypothetical protein SLEP1_g37369 [Rubroshorea leprosula]|uniref:Protein EARLY FLOWERING 4 domain-containing protein n=1 Tax=Rubroshorea leprosula TaxID=152421 RepID=A0AAV5KUL2_9ROSI|nr:hypothetical protein SLEP1_g37369 [Rubroshorea leprosula]
MLGYVGNFSFFLSTTKNQSSSNVLPPPLKPTGAPTLHATTLGSSVSALESSMDNAASNSASKSLKRHHGSLTDTEEDGDPAIWATFDKSFREVQSVLDRNWALIQQVNENHQSKIPLNMVKNVALIQELNGNISKVVSMYSEFSTNFSTISHPQNKSGDAKSTNEEI